MANLKIFHIIVLLINLGYLTQLLCLSAVLAGRKQRAYDIFRIGVWQEQEL